MEKNLPDIFSFEEFCSQMRKRVRSDTLSMDVNRRPELGLAEWITKKYCSHLWISETELDPDFYPKECSISNHLNKILHEEHQETFRVLLITLAMLLHVDVRKLWEDLELHERIISYLRFHEFNNFIN